jgi:hypothetical protein
MNGVVGHFYNKTSKAFQKNLSNIGYIYYDGEIEASSQEKKEFVEEIKQLDCIDNVGDWHIDSMNIADTDTSSCISQIMKLQMNKKLEDGISDDEQSTLEMITINSGGWNLFNINLSSGDEPERQFEVYDDVYGLLYLGSRLKGIADVGDRIEIYNQVYVVAGFLEPGSIIADPYVKDVNKFSLYTTMPLDYEVVNVYNDSYYGTSDSFYFSVNDGYTYKDAKENLTILIEKMNVDAHISNISSVIDNVEREMLPVNRYLLQILVVVGLTACIVLTCFQVMNILIQKSEFGILYSSGVGLKDMIIITFMENLLKFIGSMVVLVPFFTVVALKCFSIVTYAAKCNIYQVLVHNVIGQVILIGVLIASISSILPVVLICGYSPVELMGDKRRTKVETKFRIRDKEVFLLFLLGFAFIFVMIFWGCNAVGKWADNYSKKVDKYNIEKTYYIHSNNASSVIEENKFDEDEGTIEIDDDIYYDCLSACYNDTYDLFSIMAEQNTTTYIKGQSLKVGSGLDSEEDVDIVLSYAGDWYADLSRGAYPTKEEFDLGMCGVVVGDTIYNYVENIDGKEYLWMSGNYYQVLGIFENYSSDKTDDRIVLFYPFGNIEENSLLVKEVAESMNEDDIIVTMGGMTTISDSSYYKFEDSISGSNNIYLGDAGYLTRVREMNNEMQEGFINYIYNIKTIVIIIMYVFGIINCIMIAGIWAIRRKKDFIIMRTFGMKKRHILQNALKEFVGMTVCAMVVAVIISIGYVIISGEWNNVAGLNFRNIGIFLTALMLIMLLILVSLYMYIRDVKPAQGLREL